MSGYLPFGGGGTGGGLMYPDSADRPFGSNSARNSWANNNPQELIKDTTVVNVNGNQWWLWTGDSNPQNVDSGLWMDANQVIQGETGDTGATGEYGQLQSVDIIGDNFVFTDNSGNQAELVGAVTRLKGDTGDKGETGDTGAAGLIVTSEFVGDDIVFTDNANNQTTLADAVNTLRGEQGLRGEKGDQGTPFILKKQYASAGEMIADFGGVDVAENEMVMIVTGDGNPDNGDVYIKSATQWTYVTTLQGASSIQGVPGNDGLNGTDGADGADGASVDSATVNSDGDLEIGLDSGVDINAGRVTGLSAYEVWLDEGNTGTETDFITYLRERITYNGAEVEEVELASDSGLSAQVVNDSLVLNAPLLNDAVVDTGGLPQSDGTNPSVYLSPFRYHPEMPEMVMVKTGDATRVVDSFSRGSSYKLTPTAHGNSGLTGSEYVLSQGAGAEPNNGKYKSVPLFVFQPDQTVGFRDAFGYVNYPSNVPVDFSKGFYLTGLVSGHYAGNTSGKSFLYVGNGTGSLGNNSGVGVYFDSSGCHLIVGNSDTVIDASMTYNSQNGLPCFYRVAIYQLANGIVHAHVRDCLAGNVVNQTIAGIVNNTTDAKVWVGVDRDGGTTTVAFGELSLWIPDVDQDILRVNFRG